MATYLLDTSVIIDTLNGKRNRPNLLAELIRQGNTFACCSINVTEIYAGMLPKEEEQTEDLLKRCITIQSRGMSPASPDFSNGTTLKRERRSPLQMRPSQPLRSRTTFRS